MERRAMTKYNRKFNTRRKRMERWHDIVMRLSDFEGLINSYDGMTPEEVRVMRAIHGKLYECSVLAGEYLKKAKKIVSEAHIKQEVD